MAVGPCPLESLEMNAAFWHGKPVLLTGHTGFKGSWLSLWLQSMGAKVIGYALTSPTNPSLFEVANVSLGMTSIIGDIRDLSHLKTVFAKHQPETIRNGFREIPLSDCPDCCRYPGRLVKYQQHPERVVDPSISIRIFFAPELCFCVIVFCSYQQAFLNLLLELFGRLD